MIQLITQPDSVRVGICYRLGYGDPGWRWVSGEGRYSHFRPQPAIRNCASKRSVQRDELSASGSQVAVPMLSG